MPSAVETTATAPPVDPRHQLLSSLRGKSVRIPDLHAPLRRWPECVNPNVERLRKDVKAWIEGVFPGDARIPKLLAADFGFFGATWWPYAGYDKLLTCTRLAVWIFIWDDEIDSGALLEKFEDAQEFRAETVKFVTSCLGLGAAQKPMSLPQNPIIRSFKPIGDKIRENYTVAQRQRLMDDMAFYIQMAEVEQRFALGDRIPAVDAYWAYRMGTSAVAVVFDVIEFAHGVQVPDAMMADPDIKALRDKANENIWIVNDLLSLKKELASGAIENLIPLLAHETGAGAQGAIDAAAKWAEGTVAEVDALATIVMQKHRGAAREDLIALRKYIEGVKTYATGNLVWSLSTGRYRIPKALDGGITIQL